MPHFSDFNDEEWLGLYLYHIYICQSLENLGVPYMGSTPKWIVYQGKPHLEMDDDWGYAYFRKPPF